MVNTVLIETFFETRQALRSLCDDLNQRQVEDPSPEDLELIKETLDADYRSTFSVCGSLLKEMVGSDFKGSYLAGGTNVRPCKILGGQSWNFVGLYSRDASTRGPLSPAPVEEAGFRAINHDFLASEAPSSLTAQSQDVMFIKDPGNRYASFWRPLWQMVLDYLKPDGLLLSNIASDQACPRQGKSDLAFLEKLNQALELVSWGEDPRFKNEPPAMANLDQVDGHFEVVIEPFYFYKRKR